MKGIRISASELLETLGTVLGRVRSSGETFLIEKDGDPVAKLVPVSSPRPMTLAELSDVWLRDRTPDPEFAQILEQIGREDTPLVTPWDTSSTPAP